MELPDLSPEIWVLIFQVLPTQNDLVNVCQVSKSFQCLATPILYRSVIFRPSRITGQSWHRLPDDEDVKSQDLVDDLSFGLLHRLLDDRNKWLRAFVRELALERMADGYNKEQAWQKLEPPRDLLAILVEKLPNLEHI
ncbi:hypothetical protein P170DRAFT_473135 [Aspergillus steynii IBT 23096]|uniref:F-box domain-containing protein n=1 Tax=Aspergillus steynii IBT 23096 TaxID=1392250 RepID=A0A2I2GK58_9EURO|nr:uncharacterized protein P170DRAFT_473135 [Aspergillus steynii IBT 23096]PLB53263.1 hypothetical protein P170DRAFT_473135 [Aspergillus steynii IBT 23096]